MNTCKYEPCNNEPKGSSAYCSDSCRAQQSRRNKSSATLEAQHGRDLRGATRLGPAVTPAVTTSDQRHQGGRDKYTRPDGSVYQCDSIGNEFEVVNGKVYQTTNDVKACYV